jgi:hypothetical protein
MPLMPATISSVLRCGPGCRPGRTLPGKLGRAVIHPARRPGHTADLDLPSGCCRCDGGERDAVSGTDPITSLAST